VAVRGRRGPVRERPSPHLELSAYYTQLIGGATSTRPGLQLCRSPNFDNYPIHLCAKVGRFPFDWWGIWMCYFRVTPSLLVASRTLGWTLSVSFRNHL